MRVVCQTSCVTRADGTVHSLVRGREYDLSEDVANALVRAGHCRLARERGAQAEKVEKVEKPEDNSGNSDPSSTSKRPRTRKKLEGAPENKGEAADAES